MAKLLSPREVAASLGVSESSLKRWCDRGLLNASRTPGGHRKLLLSEVIRFVRSTNRDFVDPELVGLAAGISRNLDPGSSVPAVLDALVEGNLAETRQLIHSLFISAMPIAQICDDVLAPAMQHVGCEWESGAIEIYQERRAVEIIAVILHDLRMMTGEVAPNAPLAIGGAFESDNYDLPTRMVEMSLREIGWRTTSLGSELPLHTIQAAVEKHKPTLLWLSTSVDACLSAHLDDLVALYEKLPAGTKLAMGGRALTPDRKRQLRATVFCDTLQQLSDFCVGIYGSKPDSMIGRNS